RVGAIMRRSARTAQPPPAADGRIAAHDVSLDRDRRQARVRGEAVELTRQEFDLLSQLFARPGIVFSRAALLQSVWSDDVYVTERTVDPVISRLRRKIEPDPQDPELILTAWGVGYKFADSVCGSAIVKTVLPGRLLTPVCPPCRSTIAREMDRPSPRPPDSFALDASTL